MRRALALLEKAGCMDLVRQEALGPLPARKASSGVAAAVLACSPPRSGSRSVQWDGGSVEEAFFQPGTLDLRWQDVEDLGGEEPGKQSAARGPWQEEKEGPGAAGWMPSAGGRAGRREAADAPKGRSGGMGFAPASIAVPGEQRPGRQKEKKLQVWSAGVVLDGSQLEKWTAQERPPLLSPGKELAHQGHMVSVAIDAREGAAGLVKGVYLLDAGVVNEGGAAGQGPGDSASPEAPEDSTKHDSLSLPQASDSKKGDKEEEPVSKRYGSDPRGSGGMLGQPNQCPTQACNGSVRLLGNGIWYDCLPSDLGPVKECPVATLRSGLVT
ncbi:hypothetical protein NDU88_000153 [Pleurodeles waltl]|uniref:Uncharacterized protein n=1 Tax=Pleurodeles waltl TaxID=8319 RepID=A0AAV7S9B1_PLEWA|nr:hypothetical protein NDU88_000153 [Pleurodeles waltl]